MCLRSWNAPSSVRRRPRSIELATLLRRSPSAGNSIGDNEMFSDMRVGTRLAIAFAVVIALLLAIVAIGVNRMASINEGLRTITEENNVEMGHATSMRGAVFETSISFRNLMLYTDPDKVAHEVEAISK